MRSAARVLRRLPKFVWFFLWYLYSLVRANLQVAGEVLRPRIRVEPGIVRVPLRDESRNTIVFLANLITLTPGTITVDINDAGDTLYVHGLHVKSADELREHVLKVERRLNWVLR